MVTLKHPYTLVGSQGDLQGKLANLLDYKQKPVKDVLDGRFPKAFDLMRKDTLNGNTACAKSIQAMLDCEGRFAVAGGRAARQC